MISRFLISCALFGLAGLLIFTTPTAPNGLALVEQIQNDLGSLMDNEPTKDLLVRVKEISVEMPATTEVHQMISARQLQAWLDETIRKKAAPLSANYRLEVLVLFDSDSDSQSDENSKSQGTRFANVIFTVVDLGSGNTVAEIPRRYTITESATR